MEEFKAQTLFETTEAKAGEVLYERKKSKPFWRRSVSLNIGLMIIAVVMVFAIVPQFFTAYDPNAGDYDAILQAPSAQHFFGTDNYGRDIFARILWGTRIDVAMGIFAMLVPFITGSLIGLVAGYYGGLA